MDSMKFIIVFGVLCVHQISAVPPVPQGIKPSNVLGGLGQHASFSFVRPGLTQTSYSFNGPSSHQAFSSSIGNPNLAQKVLPNVANALAYRNPGLGYFQTGPIAAAYASHNPAPAPAAPGGQIVYQGAPIRASAEGQVDQTAALNAYLQQQFQHQYRQQYLQTQQQYQTQNVQPQLAQLQQQQQQQQQQQEYSPAAVYQAQIAQLHAYRQAQAQAQNSEQQLQQIPEQIQLQQQQQQDQQQDQQQQTQNLLGVAYSSAPSVAHVKVSGNGYNFDF